MSNQIETSLQRQRIALVTGTSSGFGLLIAVLLAEKGITVMATMRDLTRNIELKRIAEQKGITDRIHYLQLDVTDPLSIQVAVTSIQQQYGSIDILVNNAGYAVGGFIEHVPMETWRAQLETNVFGLIAVTQTVLPIMREQKHGYIINMSSVSGLSAFPGYAPYATSKFAIEGFSESLRHEMAEFNIKVVLVEPGSYRTSIWEKGLADIHTAPQSPYQSRLEAVLGYSRKSAASAPDPQQVADLVGKIVDKRSPKLRYAIGEGSHIMIWARKLLPWRVLEWVIGRALKS